MTDSQQNDVAFSDQNDSIKRVKFHMGGHRKVYPEHDEIHSVDETGRKGSNSWSGT